jgi:hypothetical protein
MKLLECSAGKKKWLEILDELQESGRKDEPRKKRF